MSESYAATRLHVMRTKLISPDEYDRLLKMSDREVVNYLQSTEYREDVDALAIKDFEDLEVVDRILKHNDERIMRKLRKISGEEFQAVLGQALLQNDLWNFGVIAEAIEGGKNPKEALELYGRKGTLNASQFTDARTLQELAKLAAQHVPGIDPAPESLTAFTAQLASLQLHGSDAALATNAFLVDEQNILAIVRSKRDRLAPERIVALLQKGGRIPRMALEKAARAGSLRETLEALRATTYADVIERALTSLEEDTLVRFEQDLHKHVLMLVRRATWLRPLGVEILVNYLAEKDIERANLRLIIKGKRLGLDEAFLRERLIT